MQSRKFKFNKRQLDSLPPTPSTSRSKETEYTDQLCSGLKIIINRQGRKRLLFIQVHLFRQEKINSTR